jgi:hypothetical protein
MAKIFRLNNSSTILLQKRKAALLSNLVIPTALVRASFVKQYLTCGKKNCRCRRGLKHGPFHYLVQCLDSGKVHKFLLKSVEQKTEARAAIAAHSVFHEKLEELSQINTELLRRGQRLMV